MNILVLVDNYSRGGLETHFNTYYNNLKDKHHFTFGFANYKKTEYLKGAEILQGFHFKYDWTVKEFKEDIERIIKIVKDKKIDVIHCNPFYNILPAMFASSITNTRLVYTNHGYGSINFLNKPADALLYQFAMEWIVGKVFCVEKDPLKYYNYYTNRVVHIPNLVDERAFAEKKVALNKTWALVSRLDVEKVSEIKNFLDSLEDFAIDKIDIYGSGACEDDLKDYIKKQKLQNRVSFKGYVDNMGEALNNYTGVLGLSRVVLEALCMNYPCFLIGEGKIVGVVNEAIYQQVKDDNFIPYNVEELPKEEIQKQLKEINAGNLKKYQFRKAIVKDFGISHIDDYIRELESTTPHSLRLVEELYEDIKLTDENEVVVLSENFFELLKTHLSKRGQHINYTVQMNIYSELFELTKFVKVENQKRFDEFSALNNRIHQLEFELKNSSRSKFSNFLRKIKRVLFKKKK